MHAWCFETFVKTTKLLSICVNLRLGKIATQEGDQYGHFTDEVGANSVFWWLYVCQ